MVWNLAAFLAMPTQEKLCTNRWASSQQVSLLNILSQPCFMPIGGLLDGKMAYSKEKSDQVCQLSCSCLGWSKSTAASQAVGDVLDFNHPRQVHRLQLRIRLSEDEHSPSEAF